MAKKFEGREAEIDALLNIPGVDPEKIRKQLNPELGSSGDDKGQPPDGGGAGVVDKGKLPDGDDKGGEGDKGGKKENVPDESVIKASVLNEIFGDRYKTLDEVKSLNILDSLQERDTLRQKVTDLETQLGKKPKHSFASDDLAKFNEFARETKIDSYEVFRKLNSTDIANMDDMDALIWQRISEDPELAADVQRVRKNFERKFDVDKAKIEAGDMTQEEYDDNLFSMRTEARNAKKKLQELKGNIKMPEIREETPETIGPKKWTPEIEKVQKTKWAEGAKAIIGVYSKIPILMKDAKEPIINFVLPEEVRTRLEQDAFNFAINNHLEIVDTDLQGNQEKALAVAVFIRRKLLDDNLPLIAHAIFERAQGMSKEEAAAVYHNPSKIEKGGGAGEGGAPTSFEEKQRKAYELEKNR